MGNKNEHELEPNQVGEAHSSTVAGDVRQPALQPSSAGDGVRTAIGGTGNGPNPGLQDLRVKVYASPPTGQRAHC
jgi:hypothetical protein